jgi:type II secretion system protein H
MTYFSKRIYPAAGYGFTLVELLVVIVVVSILSAIAAPSFANLIRSMAVRSAADELVTGIQLARSEAARANRTVTVNIKNSTWQVLNGTTLLREGTWSQKVDALTDEYKLELSPAGTTKISKGTAQMTFPACICLQSADPTTVQRFVYFRAKATSPVARADCPKSP